jgi:SAM-dependent methyltransferase
MRALVGPTNEAAFDNPTGDLVFPYIPLPAYDSFFDFGCGCGRIARQLMQQKQPPRRYLGIDLHRGMIRWCRQNLEPRTAGFTFLHHDVFNAGFNPGPRKPLARRLPADDDSFSLVNAWSVFTHLVQPGAEFYMREVARITRPEGYVHLTCFLMDKAPFPMMQASQSALYINWEDPTNAVIFDRKWFIELANQAELALTAALPPSIRGHQWRLLFRPKDAHSAPIELPEDSAPFGIDRPPVSTRPPHEIR